jgi:hypothetical protein
MAPSDAFADSKGSIECLQVPTFRPTAAEWQDPLAYLQGLRHQGELIGLVKIVPPDGWEGTHTLDSSKIRVKTKSQAVHELQYKDTVAEAKKFWASFNAFIASTNFVLNRKKPVFNGQEVDLYRLYRVVEKRGGFEEVCERKAWREVACALSIQDKGNNAGSTLKQWYIKYLQPFKEYAVTRNVGGADLLADAVETEILGTKTVVGVKRMREQELEEMDTRDMDSVVEGMLDLIPRVKKEDREEEEDIQIDAQNGKDKVKKTPTKKKEASDDDEDVSAMVCEACRGGHYDEKIILCDRCDRGWHMFCVKPKMKKVPKGDWVCPACEAARRGVDAVNTQEISLAEFERRAADFDKKWFGDKSKKIGHVQREKEFWNIVDGEEDMAEVFCAIDPRVVIERSEDSKEGFVGISKWRNSQQENLAMYCERFLNKKPVDSPVVEFGMTFSSRPWKVDEQLLYSVTYLHSGSVKQWYCIPPYAAAMYESVVQKVHSEYMVSMEWTSPLGPNLMVNPTMLMERGVPIFGCTQEKGSLVVSYPNSYSCSVNLGFNISEMLLMVLPDWLRASSQAASLYRNHRCSPRMSTEKMILNAIKPGTFENLGSETRYWLHREFARAIEEEALLRYKLWGEGLRQYRRIEDGEDASSSARQHKDQLSCCSCGSPLVFSMIECSCAPKKATCMHHRQHLCRCKIDKHRLAWRYSISELNEMDGKLKESLDPSIVSWIEEREASLIDDTKVCLAEAVTTARTSEDSLREVIIEGYSKKKMKKKRGKKAKENDPYSPSDMTLVTECGYVQGPIRPFYHLDLHPEDFQTLEELIKELERCCRKWISDACTTLELGGDRTYELPSLIDEGDEYLWGDLDKELRQRVTDLEPKLIEADDFVDSVLNALNPNKKPLLEDVEKILSTDPFPVAHPPRINELYAAVESAKEWIQRHYSKVSDLTVDPPIDSKAFDHVLFEAGKIPVAIPEAKILRERLASIKKVAEAVRIALPKNRESGRRKNSEEPLTLEFIEQLDEDAKKAHIMMPEIISLNEALDRMHTWRAKVEKALEKRSQWKEYEELIEEGKSMPVEMPDIHRLYELQDAVASWVAGMKELKKKNSDHKIPLKKLREFLAEGLALPINFPEIQEMTEYIQRFQLEEVAIKCMSSSVREEDIVEIIGGMMASPNGGAAGELAAGLQRKLDAAKSWRQAAEMYSSRSVSSFEDMVREGEATGVKMQLLDNFTERLALVHRWIQRCNRCLAGVTEEPLRSPKLHLQRSLIVECSHPLMRKRVSFIDPKEREKFPSNAVINALVNEYDDLGLDLPHYNELCVLQERAQKWLEEADPVLNQTDLTEDQIPLVESLIEKGLSTGVKIAQVDNLESYMNAYIWQKTAEDILDSVRAPSNNYPKFSQDVLTAFIAAGDVFASCKHTTVAKGLKKIANIAARWHKEANAILRPEKPKVVTKEHALEFLASGQNMPVDVSDLVEAVSDLVRLHDILVEELSDVWQVDQEYSYLSERRSKLANIPIDSAQKTAIIAAIKDMDKMWSAPHPEFGTLFAAQPIESALHYMSSMLTNAQRQLERAERAAPITDEVHANGSDASPELFCLCQQPSGVDSSMVMCDSCDAWFHATCVGYGRKPTRGRKRKNAAELPPPPFTCPVCSSIDAEGVAVEHLIKNLAPPYFVFTSMAQLETLKEQIGDRRIFKELGTQITKVVESSEKWGQQVKTILQMDLEKWKSSTNAVEINASDALLRQVLISTLAVGYDFRELSCVLLQHLKMLKWRRRALELEVRGKDPLTPCSDGFLDEAKSFLDQGSALGLSISTDSLFSQLHNSLVQYASWNLEAQSLMTEVAEPHTPKWYLLRARVKVLLLVSTKLSWPAPETSISDLNEHLAVHCLCRKQSDDYPMLCCDSCSQWMHFDCVGRRMDPALENEIAVWNCPICAEFGSGITYKAHLPIQGDAEETLSTIRRVLPRLSRGLGEADLYKRILSLYSGAPFQCAVMGRRDIPKEAIEVTGDIELFNRLKNALGAVECIEMKALNGTKNDPDEHLEIE